MNLQLFSVSKVSSTWLHSKIINLLFSLDRQMRINMYRYLTPMLKIISLTIDGSVTIMRRNMSAKSIHLFKFLVADLTRVVRIVYLILMILHLIDSFESQIAKGYLHICQVVATSLMTAIELESFSVLLFVGIKSVHAWELLVAVLTLVWLLLKMYFFVNF